MNKKILKNPVFEKRTLQLQASLEPRTVFLTVNSSDIYYLTGCTGSNNHLLVSADLVYLFTDGRYLTQINDQVQINIEIIEIGTKKLFSDALKVVLEELDIQQLKFTPDGMSYLIGKAMISALPTNAQAIQDLALFNLRSKKDEMEIELIKQNTLITKAAFLYIQSFMKSGITEFEVASELEYYCRKQGAEKMSFDTIIASGTRSALPHGKASGKVIEDRDLVQFDFGIYKNMYCSDFSRIFYMGTVDPKLAEIRQIVEDALKKVELDSRCGMTGQEIDAIARNYISEKGYGEFFVHGLGHGLGIEVHENPRLNNTWDKPIIENMVLTIEPGIYLPGLGGVRLEDTVVMRSESFELITECGYEF